MDFDQQQKKLLRIAPTAFAALLGVAALLQVMQITTMAMKPAYKTGIPENQRNFRNGSTGSSATTTLQRILDANLFGVVPSQAATAQPLPDLKLTGMLATSDPAFGWAFIQEGTSGITVYAAGTRLKSGALLRKIYLDRAVVEENGVLHTLPLEALTGSLSASSAVLQSGPSGTEPPSDGTKTLASTVHLQVAMSRNKVTGVRLYPANGLKGMEEFTAQGFQPGDQLIAINGSPITGSKSEVEMVGRSQGDVLTIRRNGKQLTVTSP